MLLSAGRKLGPYEILGPLGEGGMGVVYRARDKRLERDVAIKILPADMAANPERLTRFQQEGRSASALNHPNIITIYEFGNADSISYLAMELIDGKTLRHLILENTLPMRKRISIAVQIADGLSKAHEAGIVHRDLKPENVMITRDGLVKILDFGLAKQAPSLTDISKPGLQTEVGVLLGTVGYMSPEQASGKTLDFHSDQFSFGTILYEMIAGKRAFFRGTGVETLAAIINEEPEPVSAINPETPAPIRWVTNRCLAKDPEDRYASTQDLARELKSIRDHYSEVATSSERMKEPALHGAKKRTTRAALAGLVAGIIAGGVVVAALSRTPVAEPPDLRYMTYSGHDRSPAASPDGKSIAFASDRDGLPRIWIKQLDAPGEVVLTPGPDTFPRFSPDGSMILFIHKDGPQSSSVCRVSVLGGESRKLIQDVNSADWSPDGHHIVFVRMKNDQGHYNSSVGVANADGTSVHEIAYFQGLQIQHPRWSPDGKMIAVRTIPFGQVKTPLFLISADGKERRAIDAPRKLGWFSSAAWSGPHTLIFTEPVSIVAARSSTSGRVVEQDIQSGKLRVLFWSPTLGNTLDIVSPGRIVLDAISSRENLHEVALSAKAPSEDSRWLTKGISNDREPAYSPDGESVIFSSNRSGNLDLWAISTSTGVVRRITDDTAEDWDPAYTPNGKNILWSSSRSGHFEIWSAQADGTDAKQITNDGADAENPTATPDGQWIIYASYNPAKLGLWKIHPDGSGTIQITAGNSDLPETSPDGQYVLYRDGRADPSATIRVIRLSDRKVLPFQVRVRYTSRHEDLTVGSGGRCRWMPDGHSIVFLDMNENRTQGVFVQDFVPDQDTSNTRRPLEGFDRDAPTESFGVSPDGMRITFAGLESYSSLMLAEGVPGISPPQKK